MRISFLSLLLTALTTSITFSNASYAQKVLDRRVSVDAHQKSLAEVLDKLSRDERIKFVYASDVLANTSSVDYQGKQKPLKQVLSALLTPNQLAYEFVDGYILVRKLQEDDRKVSVSQDIVVSGRVTDEGGEPLRGVTVGVKDRRSTVVTDAFGVFAIKVADGSTLVFSYLGYQTKEIYLDGEGRLDVQLTFDNSDLDEVVVTALGLREKRDRYVSSVSSVKGEQIANSGEPSPLIGLTGKASGVLITRTSGDPGSGAYIQIRGQNTVNGDSQPLIVIDGMPISNSSKGNFNIAQQSRLNDINADDIASVDVLKGASAAALWGTRAANGVIVITTKGGQDTGGKVNVSYGATVSVDRVNKLPEVQTAYGQGINGLFLPNSQASWGDKISGRSGGADTYITDPSHPDYLGYVTFPDGTKRYAIAAGTAANPHGGKNSTRVFNHLDNVYQTGKFINHNLDINGGNRYTSFFLSYSNIDQDGVIKENSNYKRHTVRLNLNSQFSPWLTARVNASYVNTKSDRAYQFSGESVMLSSLFSSPDFDPYYSTGTYTDRSGNAFENRHISYRNHLGQSINPIVTNPFRTLRNNSNTSNVDRILGTVELQLKPVEWFSVTSRTGVDNFIDTRDTYFAPFSVTAANGSYSKEYLLERQFNADVFAAARVVREDFQFRGIAGINYNNRFEESVLASITNFVIPDAPPLLNNGLNKDLSATNRTSLIRSYAYYAQVDVEAYDQFVLTLTGRRESASTFGPLVSSSFFYPSASLGWTFTNLPALENGSVLNFGRVRLNYGEVGIQPPPYFISTPYAPASFGDYGALAASSSLYGGGYVQSSTLGNPLLGPERKSESEVGLDFKLFRNRLNLYLTGYYNINRDVILSMSLPGSTGFNSTYANAGKIRNKGLEADADVDVLKKSDFRWNVNANFSLNRNKVLSLAGGGTQGLMGMASTVVIEGQPFGVRYDVDFQKNEQGRYILDANGFPIGGVTPDVVSDPNPNWRGGIGNTFQYRNLSVFVFADAVYGTEIWNGTRGTLYSNGISADVSREVIAPQDLKTKDGQTIQQGTAFRGNIRDFGAGPVALTQAWYRGGGGGGYEWSSVRQWIEDASAFRIREIRLDYRLNALWLSNARLKSLDFSVTGRNLFLWTPYSGVDPESNGTGTSLGRGGEWSVNPGTRSFIFSVKANF